MKVLLDSNIWRYVADADAFNSLELTASENGIELVVVPALVYEARNLKDNPLRKKILKMLASPSMTRLMPEAFLEAEEIKNVIRKYRQEWLIQDPNLSEVNRLIEDWENINKGFWFRATNDILPPVTNVSLRCEQEHELAKKESKEIRGRMIATKKVLPSTLHLLGVMGVPDFNLPSYQGVPVEYWRIPSLYHVQVEFGIYASPYREWLDSEIDVLKIQASPESLIELWYYEISPEDLPRQWIRGAFEFLQSYHKVTSGTPIDSQLSSHLIDVNVVISADRNFIKFTEKCRIDAPFSIAQEYLVPGGSDGVAEVLKHLRNLNSPHNKST